MMIRGQPLQPAVAFGLPCGIHYLLLCLCSIPEVKRPHNEEGNKEDDSHRGSHQENIPIVY